MHEPQQKQLLGPSFWRPVPCGNRLTSPGLPQNVNPPLHNRLSVLGGKIWLMKENLRSWAVRSWAVRSWAVPGTVLLLGAGFLLTGLLPGANALVLAQRTGPVLLFVLAMTLVTEMADDAGLFRTVTGWLAARTVGRSGRGKIIVLWLLVVALSTVSTAFLSLDTTAVLITPIVVLLAVHAGIRPLPFALTTVWLANTASLLLPVSNLTNLLAQHQLAMTPLQFAGLFWAPALVGVLIPVAALWLLFRRDFAGDYRPQSVAKIPDRPLLITCASIVLLLLPALVSGIPVEYPALAAAAVLLLVFLIRRPSSLSLRMLPWRPLVLATGLFLVVETLQTHGLPTLLSGAAGQGNDFLALLQLAGLAAASANVVNNLPAYLALEPVSGSPLRLAAVLIGVNLGPMITPWASLATLLWHERLKALGVRISWWRFAGLGLVLTLLLLPLAVLALWLSGQWLSGQTLAGQTLAGEWLAGERLAGERLGWGSAVTGAPQ